MRYVSLLLMLTLAACAPATEDSSGSGITGTTGEPVFEEFFSPIRLSTRAEHEESQRWGAPGSNPVEVTRFPAEDPETARYGFVHTAEASLAFRVVPRADGTLEVIVDADADGDLTDESPLELVARDAPFGGEAWTVVWREEHVVSLAAARLVIGSDAEMAYLYSTQTRRGSIDVVGLTIEFALQGSHGVFDEPMNRVHLDLDGDGEIVIGDLGALGAYELNDQYLWIDGTCYRFEVTRDGSELTLHEFETDALPPSPVHAGAQAADFAFIDMEGVTGSLDDYTGEVVLLYFWGTWCGPCIHSMPDLAATYRAHEGLQVLAIAKKSTAEDVRAIMAEHDLDWRHVLEDDANPIASLYRVRGVPEYVLINSSGTIVGRGNGFDLKAALGALLPGESAAD